MSSSTQDETERVKSLVEAQCRAASYIPLREVLAPFLVSPSVKVVSDWGSTSKGVLCWVVADLSPEKEGMHLVYSEGGFGSRCHPWGILMKNDQWVGRDDQWFTCLEDAAISAGIWHGALPAEYEIR
jgi:hypothetical protein